jgi:hypothetical protein
VRVANLELLLFPRSDHRPLIPPSIHPDTHSLTSLHVIKIAEMGYRLALTAVLTDGVWSGLTNNDHTHHISGASNTLL